MSALGVIEGKLVRGWRRLGPEFLPFADAATRELPLPRLLRLALFQVSVGMAFVLLNGTLNRVMIVELGVPAWLVALMVALPLVVAPFRALVGFRSDTHRSVLGWRRVPYIWMGTLLQFGGLAILPFSLIILSGDTHSSVVIGQVGAALAFVLIGVGFQTTQTTGLALATDLATPETRPRVVALMYVMLLVGMVASGLAFSLLLSNFSELRLIQVIQGSAVITMFLNGIALWKQEPRNPAQTASDVPRPAFRESWQLFAREAKVIRFLVALGLGTAAFAMQDILLEPYGGQILHLGVGATTALTALMAFGTLVAFAVAARRLDRGADPYRLAAAGVLVGILAFACVIFAEPLDSPALFRIGTGLIGFGSGLFSVGTLTAAMALRHRGRNGLALGAWGAVQATAMGIGVAAGGVLRDFVSMLASHGALGPALASPATGYSFVYHFEILFLFITLVAIGPLVQSGRAPAVEPSASSSRFGLAEFPG
jgi:BCD family chlorophyll transporter-like MFS transporter